MAEQENSKDLISVLWSGADVLRSKMDANEYKNYLLGKNPIWQALMILKRMIST